MALYRIRQWNFFWFISSCGFLLKKFSSFFVVSEMWPSWTEITARFVSHYLHEKVFISICDHLIWNIFLNWAFYMTLWPLCQLLFCEFKTNILWCIDLIGVKMDRSARMVQMARGRNGESSPDDENNNQLFPCPPPKLSIRDLKTGQRTCSRTKSISIIPFPWFILQ